jgi:hypothetical protein
MESEIQYKRATNDCLSSMKQNVLTLKSSQLVPDDVL